MKNDFEVRVASLERSNRRYKAGMFFLLACLAPLSLFGFVQDKVPDVLKAKKFQLVDDGGKVLASMEAFDGCGAITTYNAAGNILVDIVPGKSGAGGIVVYDGNKHQNLVITDVTGGGGSIRLNNANEKTALSIGRNVNQAGSVTVLNNAGKSICLLTGDTAEGGTLITYDANGTQTDRLPRGGN